MTVRHSRAGALSPAGPGPLSQPSPQSGGKELGHEQDACTSSPCPQHGRKGPGDRGPRRAKRGPPAARYPLVYPLTDDAERQHAGLVWPFVSIVIPTYRRDDLLERLLELLVRQDYPRGRYEIVVVDDARGASVPALVERLAAEHPDVPLRALPGRSNGPATARNIGWRAARGEIIAFIDDDAQPADARWLREGVACFDESRVDGVSGRVDVPAPDPPTDFQRNVKALEQGVFITCNAYYRRAALERVGGFDERFTAPFREDSDLQFRVEDSGAAGCMVRNLRARVIHPAPPGRFAVSLRLQRYSQFNALLYRKSPRRYRAEIAALPPLHYYAMLLAALAGLGLFAAGRRRAGGLGLLLAALLDGRFFLRRVSGTVRTPRHLLDMALTSVLIPPLSIYWRLRGAWRFRVLFL